MEQQRRATNNKSKKTVRILLIITGILGLILIAVAVYFYTIGDSSKDNAPTTTTTCGCYFIDPATISECGDPRRAFKFNLNTTPSDQTCKAQCSTSELSANLLNSTTDTDLYQICQLNNMTDVRCNSMTIKDSAGKIITGTVSGNDQVDIEATFDDTYTNHTFTINNQEIEPDVVSADKLTISKTLEDLTNYTSLEIVAAATDDKGEQIYSTICRRLIEVDKSGEKSVNNMIVNTRTLSDGKTKISGVEISVGNLTTDENLKLEFTFTQSVPALTMTEGFTVDTTKGNIRIIETALYDNSNFTQDSSFESLSDIEGEIIITADIISNTTNIGKVSKEVTFATEADTADSADTTTRSSFSVTKTGTPECVERVSPDNIAQFTITITNTGETSENIESIKDKLPLGFEYDEGTTKINNVSVEDEEYVTTTTVGDTIEVVWEKASGWTISSNQTLTVTFDAIAASSALTGENLNEVIITPEKVPTNPDTLSAEAIITVQQDCDDEDEVIPTLDPSDTNTGLFDTTVGRIFTGLLTIALGWYIYTNPIGSKISKTLLNSGAYQNAEMTTWKIFSPRKYFEEKIIRKMRRK